MSDVQITISCDACSAKKTFTVKSVRSAIEPSGWWWIRGRKDAISDGPVEMALFCSSACAQAAFVAVLDKNMSVLDSDNSLYVPAIGKFLDDKSSA
jgi:hypothetical protein